MGYAFISYSTKDKDIANEIKNLFNENDIDTWIAPNNIPAGSKYAEVINKAVKNCSCLVLLLTNNSQSSMWVAKEVERAINYKKVIVPIQLESVELNDEFEMYISTDQIIPIQPMDIFTNETFGLISTIKTYTNSSKYEEHKTETPLLLQKIDIGTTIDGKYVIKEKLGVGSFCEVFLALNEKTGKLWTIKSIRKGSNSYEQFIHNLSEELSILNNLTHPGIPEIIDIIDTEKFLLIIMEYIKGETLASLISEQGAQLESDVIHWTIQLCETLAYLHRQNPPIIHNDLCPRNIIRLSDGKIKLIDFGFSVRLIDGNTNNAIMGTSGYAAPEKYRLGESDQRTDIYSLGITLYALTTGQDPSLPPYTNYPVREMNPKISKGMEYIINRCIRLQPEDRYQNISELLLDIQNIDKINKKLKKFSVFKRILSKL